jgi:cell division protein FtsB
MTPTQITILLTFFSLLITVLLGLIGWIGGGMVDQLKSIARSVSKIETDLGVLANDHSNLKDKVKDVEDRVSELESVR